MTTQRDDLKTLIKWLAHRVKMWKQADETSTSSRQLHAFYFEKYMETLVILKHVISIYLPVKHDGMQAFTCCECGNKAWSKTWIPKTTFDKIGVICKTCCGGDSAKTVFASREESIQ